jgi:hypothetical protein
MGVLYGKHTAAGEDGGDGNLAGMNLDRRWRG